MSTLHELPILALARYSSATANIVKFSGESTGRNERVRRLKSHAELV